MLPPTLKLCWWSPCTSLWRGSLGSGLWEKPLKSFLCDILSEAGKGGLGLRWMGEPLGQEGSRYGFVPVVTWFLHPSWAALDGVGGDRTTHGA